MSKRSTTDAIFVLRQMIEKHREGQENLHCVFIDLEKAYDRVPREELWCSAPWDMLFADDVVIMTRT